MYSVFLLTVVFLQAMNKDIKIIIATHLCTCNDDTVMLCTCSHSETQNKRLFLHCLQQANAYYLTNSLPSNITCHKAGDTRLQICINVIIAR